MADRVTNIITNIEYSPSTHTRRVTNIIANIEYSPSVHACRITDVWLNIEYTQNAAPTGRVQGPAVQNMS